MALAGLKPGPNNPFRRLRSVTGGGSAPVVSARQLFGTRPHQDTDFSVTPYDFPPAVIVDGLLGLGFLRGWVLTLDFARGRVGLRAPRGRWPWG